MRDLKARCKTVFVVVSVVLLALVAWSGDADAAGQTFTIRDVAVDETAGDAQAAREIALRSAEVTAWNRLIQSMAGVNAAQVAQPDSQTLQTMVQSLEFADERITTGRYQALVTVRFRSDVVLGWLETSGVAHAAAPTPTLVVLPVLDTGEGNVLWLEGGNPWLTAWQQYRGGGHIVPVVAPVADLDDLLAIDESGAVNGDWPSMQTLMGRYRADGVLVATARSTPEGMEQTLIWFDGPQGTPIPVGVPDLPAGTDEMASVSEEGSVVVSTAPVTGSGDVGSGTVAAGDYAGAVEQARTSLDQFWTAETTAPSGPEAVMVAEVPIRNLAEWVRIRNLLARPAVLSQSLPLVIGVDHVRVLLRYFGTLEQLRTGLRQVGLNLTAQGDSWIIIPL
jgi:hypothetical protein